MHGVWTIFQPFFLITMIIWFSEEDLFESYLVFEGNWMLFMPLHVKEMKEICSSALRMMFP